MMNLINLAFAAPSKVEKAIDELKIPEALDICLELIRKN